MSDPISVTASVIAVVKVALQGTKILFDAAETYKGAGGALKDLTEDVNVTNGILTQIEAKLKASDDSQFSESVKLCLKQFEGAIKGCRKACRDFAEELKNIMLHSTASKDNIDAAREVLPKEKSGLAECLNACSYTLAKVAVETGTQVKHAEAVQTATQLLGNFGDLSGVDYSSAAAVKIEKMIAKDHAFSAAGNFSQDVFSAALSRK